jgi:hypothetical protein
LFVVMSFANITNNEVYKNVFSSVPYFVLVEMLLFKKSRSLC